MRQSFRTTSLPTLPLDLRKSLSPYLESLEEIVIPAVRNFRRVPTGRRTVMQITRRIQAEIQERIGQSVHPAILCYALRVCCHEAITCIDSVGSPGRVAVSVQAARSGLRTRGSHQSA
jgi:hypothetical protein